MTGPDWERVTALFAGAVDLDADARRAFLVTECAGDEALLAEVESLVAADRVPGPVDELGGVLSGPAITGIVHGPQPGDHVGPYRIVRKLGEGGMGAVYEAERTDPNLRQRVALKLVRIGFGGRDLFDRFLVERQILARLEHPNVARFLGGGLTAEDVPYFAMEFVEGTRVDDYCDRHRVEFPQRLELFRTVCEAVQYAHQNLIVHRDIKPDNILVTADGAPKLLDFGIAKLLPASPPDGAGPSGSDTRTAQRRLTPEYASPEQVRGETITPASDVYSLGVLLHVLLTGQSPYRTASELPHELERATCEVEPDKPSVTLARSDPARAASIKRRSRALVGDLDTIVLKALRKDPARRYATAAQLADDIGRHLTGLPVLARPDTLGYRTGKFLRRHTMGVGAAAAVLLSLLTGVGIATRQATIAAAERDTARAETEKARQISQFLAGLFEASDPGVALGEEVSALELLDRGTERLDDMGELREQPDIRAAMLQTVARVYYRLGHYDRARQLAVEALAVREASLGAASVEAAETLALLGEIHYELGNMDTSEALLLRALPLNSRLLDPAHPQVLETMKSLAVTWQVQGRYQGADSIWTGLLDVERRQFGDRSTQVAETLHNLGWARSGQGRYEAAELAFREALAVRLLVRGDRHPEVARSRDGLASVLQQLGRLDEAETVIREALATQTTVLGEGHPELAHLHLNMGGVLKRKGELDSAEAHYRIALGIVRDAADEDDLRVARLLNDLAGVFEQRGDLPTADSLYRAAWSVYRSQLGDEHPFTALVLGNVASTARQTGDLARAERIYTGVLETLQSAYGHEHVQTAGMHARLAQVKIERGDFDGAEPLLAATLAVLERELPPNHVRIIGTLETLVTLYERWGRS